MIKLLLITIGYFTLIGLSGCASNDKKEVDTAESVFERAQELDKAGRTEEAIIKYQEVKNKYPYSKLATEAELAAADVSFREESYPDAQVAYQLFRDLHPKHPKTPFVIHRLALSIYHQIPETIDRDLTLSNNAIDTFNELIKQFPDSEYVAEAKEKRLECLKKLAEKELYIANFYLKKKQWQSALTRIEGIIKNHQNLGFEEQAFARASLAASKVNKKEDSERYLQMLKKNFPNSKEWDDVNDKYSGR